MHSLDRSPLRWPGWRLIGDALATIAAWYGAVFFRIQFQIPGTLPLHPSRLADAHEVTPIVVIVQLVLLYFLGLHGGPPHRFRFFGITRLAAAALLLGLVLAGYLFLGRIDFPRSLLVLFVLFDFLLLVAWRSISRYLYRPRRLRVALVGEGRGAASLARTIQQHHQHGLEVVGFLGDVEGGSDEDEREEALGERLGDMEDVGALLKQDRFDVLILVPPEAGWQTRLIDQLAGITPRLSSVLLLPGPFESLIGRMRYRWIDDLPLIEVMQSNEWSFHPSIKRLTDLALGGLLTLLLLPVMAACAIAVRVTSKGPALYRQERVGRGLEPFVLHKFRTMTEESPSDSHVLATHKDPRLTSIGGFLRSTRLNELPQLFDVLRGKMSLVGPRPELPSFAERYLEEVPGYAERFTMAPGITGLAQVNGGYHSSAENKLRYDLAYVANWSIWLDLSILLRTARTVLISSGV